MHDKLDIIEHCLNCNMRGEQTFCDLSATSTKAFQRVAFASTYAKDAVLFIEGQAPRGLFVLCRGKVRLSLCTEDGKRFVLRHCQPGDVLG